MKKFSGFIFDLDGTLVDSKHDYLLLRQQLGLHASEPILETIVTWSKSKQVEAFHIISNFEKTGAEISTPIPDAFEFIDELNRKKIPTAIFTRNSKNMTELTLQRHKLNFSMVITRDDYPAKPSPEGLIAIAKKFALDKKDILYVGDYHFDLQAGLAADIPTALFCREEPQFETSGAFLQFSHYSQLSKYA